ncbi:MAG: hypothetical protein QXO21_00380 [Candidatus Anstonellales archaeon]
METRLIIIILEFFLLLIIGIFSIILFVNNNALDSKVKTLRNEISNLENLNNKINLELNKTIHELQIIKKQKNNLELELNKTNNELVKKNSQMTEMQNKIKYLEEKINVLTAELDLKNKELEIKNLQYSNATNTIKILNEEVLKIEEKINNYISWFRSNAVIPKNDRTNIFVRSAKEKCVKEDYLILPCLSFLISYTLDFNYKSEENDKLYSIDEMLKRYYGDCEDYSLLFKAIIKEFQKDNYKLKVLGKGNDQTIILQERDGTTYFYRNTSSIELDTLGNYNIYMVCYWERIENDTKIGHCANLFTKNVISSSKDINNSYLKGSYIIEPQNGFCISEIANDNKKCLSDTAINFCENNDIYCQDKFNRIVILATDNDFFIFLDDTWISFSEYLDKIKKIEKNLASNT